MSLFVNLDFIIITTIIIIIFLQEKEIFDYPMHKQAIQVSLSVYMYLKSNQIKVGGGVPLSSSFSSYTKLLRQKAKNFKTIFHPKKFIYI